MILRFFINNWPVYTKSVFCRLPSAFHVISHPNTGHVNFGLFRPGYIRKNDNGLKPLAYCSRILSPFGICFGKSETSLKTHNNHSII